jgi:hypothetical protein
VVVRRSDAKGPGQEKRREDTEHYAEFVKGKRRRQASKYPKEETGKASMREKRCNRRSRRHEGRHIDQQDVK